MIFFIVIHAIFYVLFLIFVVVLISLFVYKTPDKVIIFISAVFYLLQEE